MHFSCGNYHNTLARSSLLLFLRDSARTAEDKEPFPHNRSPNLKHPPARLAENTNIAAEGFRASRACPRPSRPLASHAPLLSASHSFQRRCKLTCDTLMDRPNSNCPFKFRERPFQRWTSLRPSPPRPNTPVCTLTKATRCKGGTSKLQLHVLY